MQKRNNFEMAAHEMSIRKRKEHADHGQLGDTPLFDKVDWFEVAVIVAVIVVAGALAILIK